jgi:hypothetical protein
MATAMYRLPETAKKLRWRFLFGQGESPMPTDILLSIEQKRLARKKEAADLRAMLLLVPLIMCLFSIVLAVESHAFECTLVAFGLE